MSTRREELKAKLLAQAEAAIDRMLSDERLNEHMTLSAIETVVGVTEADFRQRALEEIIGMQQESVKTCPLCGKQLRNKGKRKKRVVTLRGESEIERSYYHCETCQKGYFPLDEQLKLTGNGFSHDLSKQMVWLSSLLPYEQCEQVMARIGERYVSDSSIWRQSQFYGARMQAEVERQRQQVRVERIQFLDARYDHDQRKAVSMDGGMVHIRGEGWRELKVGAVFDVESRLERNPQTGELEEMAHGVKVNYTAVLGAKADFKGALWALAVQHNLPTARNRSVVGDGALWIWDVAEDVCPDGVQVVDWFHAVEHLTEAAHALYPNDAEAKKRNRWRKTHKAHLYMGHIHKIIAALRQRGRADLALYFERHQRRMQYLTFREEGLPIGSGTVESGVKQFKHRLCGTGMRWNRDSADRMVVIRSASLSDEFDDLWQKVA